MLIKTEGIKKIYEMGKVKVLALRGIDIQIENGEYVAITGPSGSGKSTLMHILGCLDTPTQGKYFLEGEEVSTLNKKKLAAIRNCKIGFVFQTFNLLPHINILKNVELPLLYSGLSRRKRREIAEKTLTEVGLGDRLNHKPSELSGGQRQRVAIARALVNNPNVILADEPTGNLDSTAGSNILSIFEELHKSGHTIIMVTHEQYLAKRASRTIMLKDGNIVK
ncbi:MAG: macrolide ABC transporter ATP-binding protein [Candidatus Cloacimonadota bacterium]|nr:MAG: macrolide ABC transporter ATP-binding protein [Candidatus Cloacimonadota bacterium]